MRKHRRKYSQILGLKDFLNRIGKRQTIKEETEKLHFIKIKKLFSLKNNNKMKRQAILGENICRGLLPEYVRTHNKIIRK